MCSRYAASDDGLAWEWGGTAMSGTPGTWDARGARLTAILADGYAAYDGRATAEENWFERTGFARRGEDGVYEPTGEPLADVRYLEVLDAPGWRHADLLRGPAPGREPRAAHGGHPSVTRAHELLT